jgi:hypothetical protein
MSNQGLRQASIRAVTGTSGSYEGDWHALFTASGIPVGDFNGRMIAYVNAKLGTTHSTFNGALAALAVASSAGDISGLGTFSPAVATATLASADKDAGIALTGSDLIATRASDAGNNFQQVRTGFGASTGKYYFEFRATTAPGAGAVGLITSAATLGATHLGAVTNQFGLYARNLFRTGTGGTFIHSAGTNAGDWFGVAIDLDGKLLWAKNITQGGSYNDASADPAAGTGGLTIPLTTGPWKVCVSLEAGFGPATATAAPNVVSLNMGGSAFLGTRPTSFANWPGA